EQRRCGLRGPLLEFAVELNDRAGERAAAHDQFPGDAHLYLRGPAGEPAADPIEMCRTVECFRGDREGRVELVQMPTQPLLRRPRATVVRANASAGGSPRAPKAARCRSRLPRRATRRLQP